MTYEELDLRAELNGRRSLRTDAEVHDLAEKAGFKWLEPDDDEGGFAGGFDVSDLSNMRRLVNSLTIQCTRCDGEGEIEEGDEEIGSVRSTCDRCGGIGTKGGIS